MNKIQTLIKTIHSLVQNDTNMQTHEECYNKISELQDTIPHTVICNGKQLKVTPVGLYYDLFKLCKTLYIIDNGIELRHKSNIYQIKAS